MSDMDSILAVFFEECAEQLTELESGLSALASGSYDDETINAIFRAVHSIKGGAASFGLDRLVRFAHVFESAMDTLRSKKNTVTPELVALLTRSMDILSDLVSDAKGVPTSVDETDTARKLEAVLGEPETTDASVVPDDFTPVAFDFDDLATPEPLSPDVQSEPASDENHELILVSFTPPDRLYAGGDDARNLIVCLRDIAPEGVFDVFVDGTLPKLDSLAPLHGYLTWSVALPAKTDQQAIKEVFSWIEDICAPTITPLSQSEHMTLLARKAQKEQDRATKTQPKTPETPLQKKVEKPQKVEAQTIRVDLQRVDDLMNLVGELVIAQASLDSAAHETQSRQAAASIRTLTHDIQDAVMSIRAQPVSAVFSRMQRVVREACTMTGKSVSLVIEGGETEVDRTLIEKLTDPLTHMLRNAVDHGIESNEKRQAAGKKEGTITLSACHRSGRVLITVADDGGGINMERVRDIAIKKGIISESDILNDEEVCNLIFAPGFSTASTVSDLSGRGVGMDVVRQAIKALGGRITISSAEGVGTTFYLSLPLTLAILDGLLITVGSNKLIVPVSSVVESMQFTGQKTHSAPDGSVCVAMRGEVMPLVSLGKTLGLPVGDEKIMMIVENESGQRIAMRVDRVDDQTQVVIKSIEKNYHAVDCIAAATILGDGKVSLILDTSALIDKTQGTKH